MTTPIAPGFWIASLFCRAADNYSWNGTPGSAPASVNVPALGELVIELATSGDAGGTIMANATKGSCILTGVSSFDGLQVGQNLDGPPIPPNSTISLLDETGGTLTFTNNGPGGVPQGAYATEYTAFATADIWPVGYLSVSVSPSVGVTVTDYNFDGSSDSNFKGDGQGIMNYSGQAGGNVHLTFGARGTFEVSVTYNSNDPNYSTTTFPNIISVTVS